MASVALFPPVSPCLPSSRSTWFARSSTLSLYLSFSAPTESSISLDPSVRLVPAPFCPRPVSFSAALPRSARTGEPIMRGCYSGPIPNHPERETGETRVQEGRMCVARATGWVAGASGTRIGHPVYAVSQFARSYAIMYKQGSCATICLRCDFHFER